MNHHNRKDPRAKVLSMTVRYRSATLNEFIEHHSYDVSRGGVFIKTPSPFPPGTLLKFEVKIADDQRVMQGVGRVVWKRDTPGGKEEPTGMGIKFIKLDDASRAVIERLVASRGDDTMSAYDRAPEARAVEMFPNSGDSGLAEDPTVIRPRDEVLAIAPGSESRATAIPSIPVPSGPALSVGAPLSAAFSEPPASPPESRGAPVQTQGERVRGPGSALPTSRSIPRNPVTSEPPHDKTSRGVLWTMLAALALGAGFAYLNWFAPRPGVEKAPAESAAAREAEPLREQEPEVRAEPTEPTASPEPSDAPLPGVEDAAASAENMAKDAKAALEGAPSLEPQEGAPPEVAPPIRPQVKAAPKAKAKAAKAEDPKPELAPSGSEAPVEVKPEVLSEEGEKPPAEAAPAPSPDDEFH